MAACLSSYLESPNRSTYPGTFPRAKWYILFIPIGNTGSEVRRRLRCHHRLIRLLAVLAVVLLMVPSPSGAAGSTEPAPVEHPVNPLLFGIAGHAWWLDPDVLGDQLFPALDDLRVTTVRLSIDWKRFEPSPGRYDWSLYDRVLDELAARDIVVVADFNTIPAWASTDVEGCAVPSREILSCELRKDLYPAFERAARAAVSRYSWIDHWEFWNEPEMWNHFGDTTYLRYLRSFYDIAHNINPRVVVAACTLAGPEYMEYLYNVSDLWYGKGQQPWDAISYHPYNLDEVPGADGDPMPIRFDRILALHQLTVDRSGPDMKLWITEYGWHNSADVQARNLVDTLDWMKHQPFIAFAHLHMLHDWRNDAEGSFGLMRIVPDESTGHTLTPRTRFAPKPIYYGSFKQYVRENLSSGPSDRDSLFSFQIGSGISGRFHSLLEKGGQRILGILGIS